MSEYVIVRINEKLVPEFQINYHAKNDAVTSIILDSWADIVLEDQQQMVVVLSSNHVFNTCVKIPSKNEEVIRQSLPYTVEEQLANDVDDNHYAYRQEPGQQFIVSVVNKNVMEHIQSHLQKYDLHCLHLYSEIYTVPAIDGFTSFAIFNNYVIVRNGETGTTLKRTLLAQYLKSSGNKMHVAYCDRDLKLANNSSITLNKQDTTLMRAKTLVEHMSNQSSVNLLQGGYRETKERQSTAHPLRNLAISMVLLAISWLSINVYRLWSLNDSIDQLKAQQMALFIDLVPNASDGERNDPYSALQSRLKLSTSSQSESTSVGFITALGYLGQTLLKHPVIEVQSLRQRKTKLEVKLQAPNVNELNLFQSSLEENVLAMRIKTGTRNSNKEGISSIITMEQL